MSARMIVLAPFDGDPRVQGSALRPLIITTIDKRVRSERSCYIEKHEAVYDLCRGLIALTRKELGGRVRGYTDIVNGGLSR